MKKEECVLLIHPPFFRLAGSHNNRSPVELSYFSSVLEKGKIKHYVINADSTGAKKFWRWRSLYENYDIFRAGVKSTNPLYYEIFEELMSYEPTAVIICGGDAFLASVDTGNPYSGANLARLFKKHGVFTIGIGHFYSLDTVHFDDAFDSIVMNGPNDKILDVIRERQCGRINIGNFDTSIVPSLDYLVPTEQFDDIVMTSKGCVWGCTFCKAGLMTKKVSGGVFHRDPSAVVLDLLQRTSLDKIYMGDMVFSESLEHLKNLKAEFEKSHLQDFGAFNFMVEDKVDVIDEEKCQIMQDIGVKSVKIGLELFDEEALKRYNKHYETHHVVKATELYRAHEMKVIAYLMIGGPNISENAYWNTLKFCQDMNFDGYVISTYAYWNQNNRDYSEDSHFSPNAVRDWKIDEKVADAFFKLQEDKGGNSTLKNFI